MLVVITERLCDILHWIVNITDYNSRSVTMDPTSGTSEINGQVRPWQFENSGLASYVKQFSRIFQVHNNVENQLSEQNNANSSQPSSRDKAKCEKDNDNLLVSPENLLSAVLERTGTCRVIHFTRHGESEYNILGRIGGDASLSPRGFLYATKLAQHVNLKVYKPGFKVWTSYLKRTIQTAKGINAPQERIAALNELDPGLCDGMTYEEVAERFPVEFAARDDDKFYYRYPGGESYADLLQRVQPVVLRFISEGDNLLVVSHQAVLRCVLGALLNTDHEELPYMQVPLHTLMRLKISPAGIAASLEMVPLSVECVNTHRAKPKNCSSRRSQEEALATVPKHY